MKGPGTPRGNPTGAQEDERNLECTSSKKQWPLRMALAKRGRKLEKSNKFNSPTWMGCFMVASLQAKQS